MFSCSLWHMSSESKVYVGFTDDANRHTQRLASVAWVIFSPGGQLLSVGGICLGEETNNVFEYSAMI
jgi:ribonuclease HI